MAPSSLSHLFSPIRIRGLEIKNRILSTGHDTTLITGGVPNDVPRIERTRPARRPRDVYCYFDNDAKVRAPFDARGLMKRLGG